MPQESDPLRDAVEQLHACRATLRESVPVRDAFRGQTAWEGAVNVYELSGHPTATLCYAWSAAVEGSDRRRFYAVLHQPPVTSPVAAVRAAVVADYRK